METPPRSMQTSLAPGSEAGAFPCVSPYSQREVTGHLTVLSRPALLAFAEGFGASLIGGLLYCMMLAQFHPDGLELAWLRVPALSLVFGGFEMWRVTRMQTLRSVKTKMFWTLAGSLFVLWALGALISGANSSRDEIPPHFDHAASR